MAKETGEVTGDVEAVPTAGEMFGAECHPIGFVPPDPYAPCNPSVHYDGWQWRVSIRCVDYRLGQKAERSSSRNFLVSLTNRLELDDAVEMFDHSQIEKASIARVRGFEDLRLYSSGDMLMALAVACDLVGTAFRNGGYGRPEIVRLATGTSGVITHCQPLRGPWSSIPQKNWMPVADGVGATIIYRSLPSLTLDAHTLKWTGNSLDFLPSSLRGGSQAIWFDGGWLAVCHESTRVPVLSYRHRFVWFDREFQPRKVSDEFVWLAPGVEFCAGLATDGRRLVASFGRNDCEAHVAQLAPGTVRAQLRVIASAS